MGLKAGVLATSVFHDTDDEHLRVICDFVNYIFHLDDLSGGLLTNSSLTSLRTPWKIFIRIVVSWSMAGSCPNKNLTSVN